MGNSSGASALSPRSELKLKDTIFFSGKEHSLAKLVSKHPTFKEYLLRNINHDHLVTQFLLTEQNAKKEGEDKRDAIDIHLLDSLAATGAANVRALLIFFLRHQL